MWETYVRVCRSCESININKNNSTGIYTCDKCGDMFTRAKIVPNYRTMVDISKCSVCGDTGSDKTLHVHHIDNNHMNNDVSNLIVMCWKCHKAHHVSQPRSYMPMT